MTQHEIRHHFNVCPITKKFGITKAAYIDVPTSITDIYKQYTALVEILNIDEHLIDLSGRRLTHSNPLATAEAIQQRVLLQNRIRVRIGLV